MRGKVRTYLSENSETESKIMNTENIKDVVIIGGGSAGLAAAVKLHESGIINIIIIEREKMLGGILRQCIHDGFGLTRFNTSLSGPEYAQRFIDAVEKYKIPYVTNTSVISVADAQSSPSKVPEKIITTASPSGLTKFRAKAVMFAMGCRERTRGSLAIPGERPAGVFTAGAAQAYLNLYNKMIGKEVVILGSGDIGLIMARRMTLEGMHVQAVFELMPYSAGLPRNIRQCLNDYNIPLYVSHTVTEIHGKSRLEGVTVSEVDENRRPIPGTEKFYKCDTLILSVGLLPENELSQQAGVILDTRTHGAIVDEHFQTEKEGYFSAGNVLHVHDLVDFVSLEAETLSESIANFVKNGSLCKCPLLVTADASINHTIPQKISGKNDFVLSLRVSAPLKDAEIRVTQGGKLIASKKMKKAMPAEMIHIPIKASDLCENENLKVQAL